MNCERLSAGLLIVFGALGCAGAWTGAPAGALLLGTLVLPGWVFLSIVGAEEFVVRGGPGRLAFAAAFSLALITPAVLPLFVFGTSITAASYTLGALYVVLGAVALWRPPRRARQEPDAWIVWALALLAVSPWVMQYAGGNVDDWWDLAFVRGYATADVLGFAEPVLGTSSIHPRFAWSSWLLLQSLVSVFSETDPVLLHDAGFVLLTAALGLAAVDGLARAVFGPDRRVARLAAVLLVPVWIWGTDAIPYFTRLHQDKFVAAWILVPAMLAAGLCLMRSQGWPTYVLFAMTAMGTAAVHGLVYAVGVLGLGFIVASELARISRTACGEKCGLEARPSRYSEHGNVFRGAVSIAAISGLIALYPLWQAVTVSTRFGTQGISLLTPDNPVVRAHLGLGRLLGVPHLYYIVHPGAVFGSVAFLALVGLWIAWRRQDWRGTRDRVLVWLAVGPCALIFVPWICASVGHFFVPWMLYRIGWLVPVPLLVALVFEAAWGQRKEVWRRRLLLCVATTAAVVLVFPVARDRLARGMREHPRTREHIPRGSTRDLYRALADLPGDRPVLAPMGLSNLIPAMAGKPVVALSERGTVVFSLDEAQAYRRLRDRADFFASVTGPERRRDISARYGVEYAVFRRRWITAGSEARWLERSTADGFALAHEERDSQTWSSQRSVLLEALPDDWPVIFENHDYFVVATSTDEPGFSVPEPESGRGLEWFSDFAPPDGSAPCVEADILATATGYPGGEITLEPVPLTRRVFDTLNWTGGNVIWEDGPDSVDVTIGFPAACRIVQVEVTPFLHKQKREAFEIRVAGRVVRQVVRDGVPVCVDVEASSADEVRVSVRSLTGVPFGLTDLRVFGDLDTCSEVFPTLTEPVWLPEAPGIVAMMDLASKYPNSARAALGVAKLREAQALDDAVAVVSSGLRRGGRQAAPWIELGLFLDASGDFEGALAAYRRGRLADSNSAWARGCLAWADFRRGHLLSSLYQASRAVAMDPRYADAYTILALSVDGVGASAQADDLLREATRLAPRRNWGFIVRARLLAERGEPDQAANVLRQYLSRVPHDTEARLLLASIYTGTFAVEGG